MTKQPDIDAASVGRVAERIIDQVADKYGERSTISGHEAAASLNPIHLIGKGKPPLSSNAKPSFRDGSTADAARRCASKPNHEYRSDVSDIPASRRP